MYELIGKAVVYGSGAVTAIVVLWAIAFYIRCAYFSYLLTKWLIAQELDSHPGKKIKFQDKVRCWLDHFDAEYSTIRTQNGAVWNPRND